MPNPFICPHPLVYADHTKEYPKHYTTHWAYKQGNCAVRCPTIVLTEHEFNDFNDTVWYVSLVAFSFAFIVLLFHLTEASRYSLRIYFILGFLTGSFAFLAFPPLNKNYQLICSEDRAHYIEQNPICVSQSTFLVYSFSWIAIWGAIYAFDIYLVTLLTFDQLQLTKLRKYYPWFALLLTTSITSVGLLANNYGFDYTTSLPNCLYLFAENDIYFWTTLVTPYSLSIFLCFLASLGTIYRLQSVFVSGRRRRRNRPPLLQSVMNSFNRRNEASNTTNLQSKKRTIAITSLASNSGNSTATKISSPAPGSDDTLEDSSQSINFEKKWGSVDAGRGQYPIDSMASDPPDLFGRTFSDPNYNKFDQPDFGLNSSTSSPQFETIDLNSTTNSIVTTTSPITGEGEITNGERKEGGGDVESGGSGGSGGSGDGGEVSTTIKSPLQQQQQQQQREANRDLSAHNIGEMNRLPVVGISNSMNSRLRAPIHYISSPSESSRVSFNIELSETTDDPRPTHHTVPDDDFMMSISSNDFFVEMQESSISTATKYNHHHHNQQSQQQNQQQQQQQQQQLSSNNNPILNDPSKSGALYSNTSLLTSQNLSSSDQYHHHHQYQHDQDDQDDQESYTIFTAIKSKLSGTWKYNGRVIIFISVYCAISFYILPVLVYLFHTTYNKNVDSAEDFIACLVGASFRSVNQTQDAVDKFAREQCGTHPEPRPPFALMVSVCYWGAGFGIIPAIIFGSIFFEKFQVWFRKTFPKSLKTPLLR